MGRLRAPSPPPPGPGLRRSSSSGAELDSTEPRDPQPLARTASGLLHALLSGARRSLSPAPPSPPPPPRPPPLEDAPPPSPPPQSAPIAIPKAAGGGTLRSSSASSSALRPPSPLGALPPSPLGGSSASPSPSRRPLLLQRHSPSPASRRNSFGGRLLGSFEQNLLAGAAPDSVRRVEGFGSVLSIAAPRGSGARCPAKRRLPFAAECAAGRAAADPPPYSASVALDGSGKASPGSASAGRLRVPSAGTVVLVLCNPEETPIYTFRVPYDFAALPPGGKAYVRQRVMGEPRDGGGGGSPALRYALHLRFVAAGRSAGDAGGGDAGEHTPRAPRLYLQGDLRIVFPHRAPDADLERLSTVEEVETFACDGPV